MLFNNLTYKIKYMMEDGSLKDFYMEEEYYIFFSLTMHLSNHYSNINKIHLKISNGVVQEMNKSVKIFYNKIKILKKIISKLEIETKVKRNLK